jgi:hypothetical protein
MDTHGQEGEPGRPGSDGGGRGGQGGKGGDASRTDWSDSRLGDRFMALDSSIARVEAISSRLVWTFVGFLVSSVIGLLAAAAMLVVTLAR